MKKLFALFLVLAMLIPLGLVPVASADDVTVQPFYTLGWSDFDETKFQYLDGLVQSNFGTSGANAYISYGGATVTYNKNGLDDAKVTKFAEAMKKTMDARPAGTRYWHLWAPAKVLRLKPENVIYLDYGVTQLKALTTAVMAKYKEIGGQLDGIVIDTEYVGMSAYYLYTKNEYNEVTAADDPLLYSYIVKDPRYATEVRPLLEERGFQFYHNVTDYTPEIYSVDKNAGSKYEQSQSIWNIVMRNRLSQYLNDWAYEPLKTYFPEASMSDYCSADRDAWFKIAGASENGEILTGGNTFKAGTASSYDFYFTRPGGSFYKALNKYTAFNDAVYEGSPFNSFLFETNFARTMYLSNDMRQIAPWIVRYNYKRFANMDMTGSMSSTPYYAEQIYHLGMLDPEPFLAYMYTQEFKDENGKVSKAVYEDCANVVNEMMAELTKVAGYSDRKPVEMAPYWNSEFVLSGMYANGRNIWRLTPNTDEVSKEAFLVSGTPDPTFRVKGQTVTFPGGKIIEDASISHVGTVGYWIETAKDVTPIITREDNYFANYPSLIYDFEDVEEGTYDYNNHTPLKAWEFTWKKGATTTIEKVGDNKVLAIRGTAEVRSAQLPGNITAGDSYAEDQAWKITVNIPEGLADDAEIILLNYAGTKQKAKDGGFKLAGGKLYYSTVIIDEEGKATQEYKEMGALTPGTYTFERVMDMNDSSAFYATYNVYDAEGNKTLSTKKIAVPVYNSITTINFATKNIGDKVVTLDDYKIILTGLTADFELYDAATGMPERAEGMETPRASSTAYRLSWLNATAKEETATVMAAFYQGETLVEEKVIKEIKMAAGYDGIETGIVELSDGQTVKVYLKSTYTRGGNTEKAGLGIGMIALIASTTIVIIAIAVALITNKVPAPKAQTADAPEEKTEE